jgi:hypothetical protein
MDAIRLNCEKCGRIDSTLRVVEFFDGEAGVWCATHARAEKRTAEFHRPPGRPETPTLLGVVWTEPAEANAALLTEVALELRRRGEVAEAERAEESARQFTDQTAP